MQLYFQDRFYKNIKMRRYSSTTDIERHQNCPKICRYGRTGIPVILNKSKERVLTEDYTGFQHT